jgi:Flp pilus assembly protein TadB
VVAASLLGVAVLLLLGGVLGIAVATAGATAVVVVVPRLPSAADRRARERLELDLPVAADLIAACLVSGSPLPDCLAAVGDAVGGPVGEILAQVVAALRLGADAGTVWDPWATHPAVGPLARVLRRSSRSGAPTAAAVHGVAETLRAARSAAARARAHGAGVRAVAPLGLCFLPAFLLLGVAPTVIGLATAALAG